MDSAVAQSSGTARLRRVFDSLMKGWVSINRDDQLRLSVCRTSPV